MNNKCIICGNKNTDDLIDLRLNKDDGFCQSSETEYLCSKCFEEKSIYTEFGLFININKKLFHKNGWGAFNQIRSKSEIDYIFNPEYHEVIKMFNSCR